MEGEGGKEEGMNGVGSREWELEWGVGEIDTPTLTQNSKL